MLLLADLAGQVKTWQDIFGGGPLAAFLGLMIVAQVVTFGLYIRSNGKVLKEKDDHAATIRTVITLSGAIERTWSDQLRKDEEAQRANQQAVDAYLRTNEKAMDLQYKTLSTLQRAVEIAEWLKTQPPTTRTPP